MLPGLGRGVGWVACALTVLRGAARPAQVGSGTGHPATWQGRWDVAHAGPWVVLGGGGQAWQPRRGGCSAFEGALTTSAGRWRVCVSRGPPGTRAHAANPHHLTVHSSHKGAQGTHWPQVQCVSAAAFAVFEAVIGLGSCPRRRVSMQGGLHPVGGMDDHGASRTRVVKNKYNLACQACADAKRKCDGACRLLCCSTAVRMLTQNPQLPAVPEGRPGHFHPPGTAS